MTMGDLANDGVALGIASLLGTAGLGVLAWQLPRLRGTTLTAPWGWSLFALVCWWLGEAVITMVSREPAWVTPARFAIAMITFCPTMALLGAKRPQHRGWQLIVLSLWLVLSLPSVEWLLDGGVVEIHSARLWFLFVLIGTGAVNGMATRYWLSSLLYGAGQAALVAPFFLTSPQTVAGWWPYVGMAAIVLAWWLIALGVPRRRTAGASLDRVWLDFRDAFGLAWSLRVAERMNASARMYDWPVELSWRGFVPRASQRPVNPPHAVEDSLRTLLRRFVSSRWIDDRIGSPAPGATDPAAVTTPT
jgi:hypothetical protein